MTDEATETTNTTVPDPVKIVAEALQKTYMASVTRGRGEARMVLNTLRLAGWRIVREADDDPHYVTFDDQGWAIEHSAGCRNAGSMLDCSLDIELRDPCNGPPPQGVGRYRVEHLEHGFEFVPAEGKAATQALLFTEEWTP